ncbi:MAG: VOC family protein [Caldilineaceae bacterium]
MSNACNWFEIPVVDFDRSVRFYSTILDTELHTEIFYGAANAFLPFAEGSVGGTLSQDPKRQPAKIGTIIYLNANGKLDEILSRIEPAGGTVVLPKTSIGPAGFIATFVDSEGNLVGLHSEVN